MRTDPPDRPGESPMRPDPPERAMARRLDELMRRRLRDDTVTLDEVLDQVLDQVRQLHAYRAGHGRPARLDERVGKLDDSERLIALLLVAEGRNVTHVPPAKSGQPTPDLVVDGELAEVKTSIGANIDGFTRRLEDAQARRVFVNATASLISSGAMSLLVRTLIDDGYLTYTRVIGDGYDDQFGRW